MSCVYELHDSRIIAHFLVFFPTGEDLVPEPSLQVQEDPEALSFPDGTTGLSVWRPTAVHSRARQPGHVAGNARVERGTHPDTSAARQPTERPQQSISGPAATAAAATTSSPSPGAAVAATDSVVAHHAGSSSSPSTASPRLGVTPVVRWRHVG